MLIAFIIILRRLFKILIDLKIDRLYNYKPSLLMEFNKMIAATTLKILSLTEAQWRELSPNKQIRTILHTLKKVHPDHNQGQDGECKELLEFYKFIKNEENQYEKTYCTDAFKNITPQKQSGVYRENSLKNKATEFFSDFKEKVKKEFNGDWNKAYQSIFIVKNERNITGNNDDPLADLCKYRFHISKLWKLKVGNAQESDFDNALSCLYLMITDRRYQLPFLPSELFPPAIILDRELSLKILSLSPNIVSAATVDGFPSFWKDANFWLEAISINVRVFDFIVYSHHIEFVSNILKSTREFNDKDYMRKIIDSCPWAVDFLGDTIQHDVELITQAMVSYYVLGLDFEIRKLCKSLPDTLIAIDGPLAENLLKELGLKYLYLFANTNSSLYFQYLHQACLLFDMTNLTQDSECGDFLNSLPQKEKQYALQFCRLMTSSQSYKEALTDKIQSSTYIFFPYQLQTYQNAIDELILFLKGQSDVQTLNQYLPDLYHSSLKEEIKQWIALQETNPMLKDIKFEPSEMNKWFAPLHLRYLGHSILLVGYAALLSSGVHSLLILMPATMVAVLCVIAVEKFNYDSDDSQLLKLKHV